MFAMRLQLNKLIALCNINGSIFDMNLITDHFTRNNKIVQYIKFDKLVTKI